MGMNITPEMMVEDEKRWHARDVITELSYCGNYMRDRKSMTNIDIRFYAYLMRKAHDMLKTREPRVMSLDEARETLHTAEFLYCEDKNDDTRAGGLLRGVRNGSDYWDLINGEYMTPDCLDEGEDLETEYGKTFRFWIAKPTPEQMRDTPWEERRQCRITITY